MCEPATLAVLFGSAATAGTAATAGLIGTAGSMAGAGMALSAASSAAGLLGQQNAASYQAKMNQQQAQNLMLSRAQNANQIGLERQQATDQAGQKINQNNIMQRQAQSTAIAAAGPGGMSVDALIADMGRKGATYNQSVTENLDRTNLALDNQLQNVNTQTTNGFNQMKTPATPDYLGTALKIGNDYQKYKTGS